MNDQKRLIYSLFFPVFLIIAIWGVKLIEVSSDLSFVEWGIYPKEWYGLKGILFSPFIHADFKHLFNNSVPLFIVSYLLIYFYKEVSYKAFFLIWIITGIWVWFGARESFHIGASGVVYGIISFVFFSGIIRRDMGLMTISLLMVFLYGSMIWGVFPFIPDVSWESHLSGGVAGLLISIFYRHQGPQRKEYFWDESENAEDEETDIQQ